MIACRRLRIQSADPGVDLRQKVCSKLRHQGKIAVPSRFEPREILVVDESVALPPALTGDDWRADLLAQGRLQLQFDRPDGLIVIADLVQKAVVVGFEGRQDFWRCSNSIRYWYEVEPVRCEDGIEMIPRISFSTQALGAGRVGLAFDFGHLFQTRETVAEFLGPDLPHPQREELRSRFNHLRRRDAGGRGTLMYDTGKRTLTKCYFHDFADEVTCASTGAFSIGNDHFDSLHEYYERRRPSLGIAADDSVVYVSFESLGRPKPVAARLLRLRVSLDQQEMPRGLRRLSMPPHQRRVRAQKAWSDVGQSAVGKIGCVGAPTLWRPAAAEQEQVPGPELVFNKGRTLMPPKASTVQDYREYYRQRLEKLRDGGLYRFESSVPRELWFVTPTARGNWSDALQQVFVADYCREIENITGLTFTAHVTRADDHAQLVERLRRETPATAVIVFDERELDGTAYYLLSDALKDWRLKRLTRRKLEATWFSRLRAAGDEKPRAERDWLNVIRLSVLDTLDQMDAVPWRLANCPYDACLAIDVSERRKYFALSLVICRDAGSSPSFWRYVDAWTKPDPSHEAINPVILQDKIAEVLEQYGGSCFAPLRSLLVLRDGGVCGEEPRATRQGLDRWMSAGSLSQNADIHVIDYHKTSVKDLRMWELAVGETRNVLEGRAVYLDERTGLLCCTGAATLPAGATAEPSLLIARDGADIRRAVRMVFALAQLNYSSPAKAHRYPLPLRDADTKLRARMAADTRGIR